MSRYVRAVAFALSIGTFPGLLAQEQGDVRYTRFLLPLYHTRVPGAHGSLWAVETWTRYTGSREAVIVPALGCGGVPCIGIEGALSPEFPVVPFRPIGALEFPSGVVVHVDAQYAPDVVFASRVRDLSRQRESAGAEVPVVREDRMLTTPLTLLNVPMASQFRHALRIYALPDVPAPEVEVRYLRQPEVTFTIEGRNELLRQERVRLTTYPPIEDYPLRPAAAMIGNVQSLPELLLEDEIWIEVVPVTPGLRIWAMVSVTNNETQEVTLITPASR